MSSRKQFHPGVDGLESRIAMATGFAAPAAVIGPMAVSATKITGTIPMVGNVQYNPATGLNLFTAYGHGTISPFGKNTWVTIQVAQAPGPNGSVAQFGAMFIYSRYGVSAATLTAKSMPVLTPGSFTLPAAFAYGITSGPGSVHQVGGSSLLTSAPKGLRFTFG